MVSARKQLKSTVSGDSGQSLPLLLFMLTVIIVVCALAIDASNWMVRHHQAQVVADSAALAAANCLANPTTSGSTLVSGTSYSTCSSDTDQTDAKNLAVAYAGANGVTITTSNVSIDTGAGTVTVTANLTTPAIFGTVIGLVSGSQTARATASYRPSVQNPCSTPGSSCDLFYANGTCTSTSSPPSLYIYFQGSASINGGAGTNGNLDTTQKGNGGGITGTGTYGQNCGDNPKFGNGNHNPWTTDPTAATSTLSWPVDYRTDFPACYTGTPVTGESACASNGYPTWCTQTTPPSGSSWSSLTPVSGNIYCDAGTTSGVSDADPTTWTGQITLNATNWSDTFVAGGLTYSGSSNYNWSSCGYSSNGYNGSGATAACTAQMPAGPTYNYPVFYLTQPDPSPSTCVYTQVSSNTSPTGCALNITSTGQLTIKGDSFVPLGTVNLNYTGGSGNYGFFEANTIIASLAGNYSGDGPNLQGGTNGATLGGDALIQ